MNKPDPSTLNSLRAIADPTRLRVFLLLRQQELNVFELQEVLGMGQSRISTYLAQLRNAGLVQPRRSGRKTFYTVSTARHPAGNALEPLLEQAAREIPERENDRIALDLLIRRRRDTAREYFDALAGRFGQSHCPGRSWEAYAQMLAALIPSMVIADLGAGEGTLSLFLARNARKVIAVDSSEKMVAFGTRLAKEHGLSNIEYRLGDMEDPPIRAGTIDLVLFSQALHHAENPERTLEKAAGLLRPGGRLVVLDLAAHQVKEAREMYADRWLGFSQVELYAMLERAGLKEIDVRIVYREAEKPHFETLFAVATRPSHTS